MKRLVAGLGLVALAVAACGGGGGSPSPSTSADTEPSPTLSSPDPTPPPSAPASASAEPSSAESEPPPGGSFECLQPDDPEFALPATVVDESGLLVRCSASIDPDWPQLAFDAVPHPDPYRRNDPDDPAVVRIAWTAFRCQDSPSAAVTSDGDGVHIAIDLGGPPEGQGGCDAVGYIGGIAFRFSRPMPIETVTVELIDPMAEPENAA